MNQVYFYPTGCGKSSLIRQGLNPFMNQVYFYVAVGALSVLSMKTGLNPFMNQVYF